MQVDVGKLDAGRRQLVAAIRMFFREHDPVVTHTVASAGAAVISDLLARQSGIGILRNSAMVREEFRAEVARAVRKAENFLKHADRDPTSILAFETRGRQRQCSSRRPTSS